MSCRLEGFDYTRPFFYMVTLKKRAGVSVFSELAPPGSPPPRDTQGRECWLLTNGVTRAFAEVIRGFSERWRCLAPIKSFIVIRISSRATHTERLKGSDLLVNR